ncbi:uncharacterized protein LOC130665380 [Microplitis mediator]|uniref:uncharacterized protein LOC130665380 n=1 Tax=Microplitis mediator TaxID=375433 RepID=UPI0025560741|nr:uncharacterized protein LOC130665380 [Microplitis mediator]
MDNTLLADKPTLVRRVSDLLKDGSQSTPLLFNNPSIQKLRHCCQNLNLFPYLIYSLGDSETTNPEKFTLTQLTRRISEKIFPLYANVHSSIRQKTPHHTHNLKSTATEILPENLPRKITYEYFEKNSIRQTVKRQRSLLLIYSIYLTQIILVTQLLTLLSLMFYGKFSPGFIFLFTTLLLLCSIIIKIFFAENPSPRKRLNRSKRKND